MNLARFVVRHPWWAAAIGLFYGGVGAFLAVTTGVVPIKASSGHWPATEWVLQFAMRRAVTTQSRLAPSPPRELDDLSMAIRGAAHFELGCRFCHGAPGDQLPPIARALLPTPPGLVPRVPSWSARQLFFIVKHGVKFTGMPAWPAPNRDDEVWAIVSFLRRLPQLGTEEYQRLTGNVTAPIVSEHEPSPDLVLERCAGCHGLDGGGRGGAFPTLAGQRMDYLQAAMQAYAEGRRFSGTMQTVAVALTPADRAATSRYYSGLRQQPRAVPASAAAARGAAIAEQGVPALDIPACNACHRADTEATAAYPRLSGQPAWYIVTQLELLKARRRGGSAFLPIMQMVADRLGPSQIREVAAFYAESPP